MTRPLPSAESGGSGLPPRGHIQTRGEAISAAARIPRRQKTTLIKVVMNIEVFLTEAEIAQEFAESIEARDLPEKFFYWFPRSVRAWLDLSQNSVTASLRQCWESLSGVNARHIAGDADATISVISFG